MLTLSVRLVNVLGGAVAVQQRRSRISRAPYNNQRPALLPSASKMVALYLSAHLCTLSAAHSAARLVCCPRWTAGNPHSHHTAAGHFMINSDKSFSCPRVQTDQRAQPQAEALCSERDVRLAGHLLPEGLEVGLQLLPAHAPTAWSGPRSRPRARSMHCLPFNQDQAGCGIQQQPQTRLSRRQHSV